MPDTMSTYRTITPYLCVPDADGELTFIEAAFGGVEAGVQRNADKTIGHAEIKIGDSLVMLAQSSPQWGVHAGAIHLWVEDVDGTYAKALAAGATSQSAPEDKPYGHRTAGVLDRNGISWWISSPVK